ncbi:MAG: biotin-dependent carboxyltransferase family protein [Leeuwenhoekiella sp.]
MAIEIIQPGFYTTIQDLGRMDYAHLGVPKSGVMDSFSAKKANLLLNNPFDAAVLEITMKGPKLKFLVDSQFSVCGAEFELYLNGNQVSNSKPHFIKEGSELRFGSLKRGFRGYLAVLGGIASEDVLGSRSQYEGITGTSRIAKRDIIEISGSASPSPKMARVNYENQDLFGQNIPAYPGPEYDLLPEELQRKLFGTSFTLSPASNRMAIPFKELLPNNLEGILTGPVLPGTVQLTPNGNLIALMRDCQTTGGYPRVLQISDLGLCRLAQKRPGEHINFLLMTYAEQNI